jgi:hypothetical protein
MGVISWFINQKAKLRGAHLVETQCLPPWMATKDRRRLRRLSNRQDFYLSEAMELKKRLEKP